MLRGYNKGDVVFREGDCSASMFKIIEGSVSVEIASEGDESIELTKLGAGKIFGEMAVFETWPRSATIIADEDGTKLLEIEYEEIDGFFMENPEEVRNVMANLSRRLRELTDDYRKACRTIQKMDETEADKNDDDSLLEKIRRFITIYNRTMHYLTAFHESNIQTQNDDLEESRVGIMSYGEDTVIYTQDEESSCMYYVRAGSIGIYTDYDREDEQLIASLSAGSFFGEMGLIEKLPRSATAVVLEDDTLLQEITEERLGKLYEVTPGLVIRCMKHFATRLRDLTRDYLAACEMIAKLDEAKNSEKKLTEEEKAKVETIIAEADVMRLF